MKTIYTLIQLAFFLTLGIPAMTQSALESTFAATNLMSSSIAQERSVKDTEVKYSVEDYYEEHTVAAQFAIRAHLESRLSYSEQLYAHRVVGRVILVVDLDAEGQVSAKGIHQNLSAEADALAMDALDGLTLAEGPYLGTRTIYIPVDFKLE
jgi:hypothetical protein